MATTTGISKLSAAASASGMSVSAQNQAITPRPLKVARIKWVTNLRVLKTAAPRFKPTGRNIRKPNRVAMKVI